MFPHSAVHQLWWLAIAGGGAAARFVQLRVRPPRVVRWAGDEPTARLLHEQEHHGYNAHSLVSIAPGARLWSCPEIDGAITYNEFGKVWLVPGDPLASEEHAPELTRRFILAAREEGRFAAFIPATERFAMQAGAIGLHAIKVGAAPYFDLTTWAPRGDRAKKARAGVNQARRAGVRVTQVNLVDQTLKDEAAVLCRSWLRARRCAINLGWLFALDPFEHAARKKFFTARDAAGKLVGFLAASPMPARDGWYLEDVLRLPTAPSGTADLLVVEALNFLKLGGAKLATLGTSPLAREGFVAPEVRNHQSVANAVRLITGCFAGFYNFEGVRRFKTKFAPSWWESEYLLCQGDLNALPHLVRAFIQAIAPDGASKMITQQIARALRPERSERNELQEFEPGATETGNGNRGWPSGPEFAKRLVMKQDNRKRELALDADTGSTLAGRHYFGQFVSVDGLRLHYVSKGSGRPVVFLHGNPGSHHDYSMTVLGAVSESYRAFAFDRPGHGNSERQAGRSSTVEVQARLLRDAMRELAIERPLIVGHSWGGALALAMALEYEDELSGLVLLAPAAYPSGRPQWWSGLPVAPLLGNLFLKTLTPLIGLGIIKASLKEAYHPQPLQEDYLRAIESLWIRPSQVKACAHDDRSLNGTLASLSTGYSDINLPVVIVTGDSDSLLIPQEQACRLHETIRGSELVTLPGTGHQIPQTQPASVIQAIERAWELAQH